MFGPNRREGEGEKGRGITFEKKEGERAKEKEGENAREREEGERGGRER